jgi:PAS domain S-box-containing protein
MDKSLESYHDIIKNAPLGSILIDIKGRVIDINQALIKLLELPPKEVKKIASVFKFQAFVDAGIATSLTDCIDSGERTVTEHCYRIKQGGRIYIRVNAVPVTGDDKVVAGIWAVVEDITRSKQIEMALQASEDQYESLVEAAMEGIMIVQDGTLKYVNNTAAKALGTSKEKLINMSYLDYVHPDSRDAVLQRYRARMAGEEITDPFVVKVMNTSGEVRYAEIAGSLIYDEGRPADLLFFRDVTERKRIEDGLNEARKRAQRYLDTAEVIMLALDASGSVSLINRKGCQVLGYSEKDIIGKNWFNNFLPVGIRELSRNTFMQYMTGEKPIQSNFISLIMTGDKQQRAIDWHNAILHDENGNNIGSIHSGTDITEQRKMQKELSLSARLLDLAIDSIYMLDDQGNFVYVNENTCKTRGYEKQEMLNMNVRKIVAREYEAMADERIRAVIEKGENIFETVHVRKDGSTFPVEVHSSRFTIDNKTRLIAIARDITERKLADQVLSRSEERFRTILEEMDNGYFELDQHGNYIFVNDAMCKILGLQRSDIVSKHFSYFTDKADEKFSENIKAIISEVVIKGNNISGLFGTIVKGDGTRRIIGISTSPMKDAAGKITGVRGITRDITDRMKMEQQLLIASKLASIGELAAGVAHEINNPLTAITGFAQLLMAEDALPAQVKSDLEKIYSQSQRAAKIVQNLLTFSRSYSLEKQVISINDVIMKTLDMRSYEHKVNNIEVITELAHSLPGISADENQIQQVILNIVVNAEQSIISKRRSGIIKITTTSNDHEIKVIIADNGPGIPQELLDRIFDPFFTTKDVGSGTGLGLSVCHGIITKHGGKLSAESIEGSGATFIIALPAASEEESKAAEISVISRKAIEKSGVKRSILVVDDEVVIRDILQRILADRGYEVESAESGAEGLEKIEKREYDAYLLDIKMPGVDGKDLFEAINKNSPHLINRVIFITGDTITRSTQDFLESTGRTYLSKPFDFARLIGSIEESISAR